MRARLSTAGYSPKLTRYERQRILLRTAELLNDRKEEISDLVTQASPKVRGVVFSAASTVFAALVEGDLSGRPLRTSTA
jgi:acyl-CoA reductase-like NAD-dependent aldehyde dehydrogenase